MPDHTILTEEQVRAEDLADWRMILRSLHARFATGGFTAGLDLVNRIGEAAEEADHHPDLDLRYTHLDVDLASHDSGGVTERDVDLARRISGLAAQVGATAEPRATSSLELGLDTPDAAEVLPFWLALYGLTIDDAEDGEVVDPHGRLPTIWFQDTDPHDVPRQRFHLDVWVPVDEARNRIAAVLAAGGTLVSEDGAPSFWVLVDAQGNRACICTDESRG